MKTDKLKATDFQPLWDNVIVMPIKVEQRGEFVRPQGEEDKAELGEVVVVSRDIESVRVGDTVLFNKYSTTKIDFGDELVLRAEDIVAVVKR